MSNITNLVAIFFTKGWKKNTLFLLFIFTVYFSFGLHHLGKFRTADEDLWTADPITGRIQNYWPAIKNGDWLRTRISDKPGVTLGMTSGFVATFFDTNPNSNIIQQGSVVRIYNPEKNEKSLFYFRLPILILNALISLAIFFLLQKITKSDFLALSGTAFILLSPILLGISQIINPDSLVWSFSFAAFLSYILFLSELRYKYAVFASVLLGFALLSKYVAVIHMFFFFLLALAAVLFRAEISSDRESFRKAVLRIFLAYPLIVGGAILVFAFFMPAAIVRPDFIYKATVGFKRARDMDIFLSLFPSIYAFILFDAFFLKSRIVYFVSRKISFIKTIIFRGVSVVLLFFFTLVILNWTLTDNFLNVPAIPFDAGLSKEFNRLGIFDKIMLELKPITYTTVPLVFFLFIFTLLGSFSKEKKNQLLVFSLVMFIVSFYVAVIKQRLLVHVRYSVILYPFLSVMASLGAGVLLENKLVKKYLNQTIALLGIIVISVASLWLIRPFYFNYTNFFLPKDDTVVGAWGYGGYEAAKYIKNQDLDLGQMTVWADYDGVCPFIMAKCIKAENVKWFGGGYGAIDYFVVTRRGLIRNGTTWEKIKEMGLVDEKKPDWELLIDGRKENFVRVYRKKALPENQL